MYRFVDVSTSDLEERQWDHDLLPGEIDPVEKNPAMGVRGAQRLLGRYEPLLLTELDALKEMYSYAGDKLSLLVPFVRTSDEARTFHRKIHSKMPGANVGCMIEVPIMLYLGVELVHLYDYFVIGTKDLMQFEAGIDRDNEEVWNAYASNPSIIKAMVARCATFIEKVERERSLSRERVGRYSGSVATDTERHPVVYITDRLIYSDVRKRLPNANIACLQD